MEPPRDWSAACRRLGEGEGEGEEHPMDWAWLPDTTLQRNPTRQISNQGTTVLFHPNYSSGTAHVRGPELPGSHHHFWEVVVESPVYGTDVMVGIATEAAALAAGARRLGAAYRPG